MSSTMGGSLRAYSDLFRVENSLTGLIGVVIGAVVVNGANFTTEEGVVVFTFGLSVMFIMFSWNAYNDLTDVENERETLLRGTAEGRCRTGENYRGSAVRY